MGRYDVMQVCLGGHQITDSYNSYPQHRQDFCDKCGRATVTKCLSCGAEIRGDYIVDNVISASTTPVPMNCRNCGKAYPWKRRLTIRRVFRRPKWLRPFMKWLGKNLVKVVVSVAIAVITAVVLVHMGIKQ